MAADEEIQKVLDNISPEAVAWSRSHSMSVLIAAAMGMQGQELREFIKLLVQLSYDQGAGGG